ncbi:MAG: hypothetical protein AMJ69_06635 [Gammaproteobacteria bacterium SG8_47]|nr:MAG: hypothetical protein AMJ69_06635 [Gammaproteobacteria bacterium SG8_47]
MQLRHKFFLVLALLTTVPLLVLLFGVVERAETEVKGRTEQVLHSSLDKMAGELEVLLNGQKAMAMGLARVPSVRRFADAANRGDQQTYERYAEELGAFFLNYQHAVPDIQALRFIDTAGRTLVKVKEGKPVEPVFFDEARQRHFIADQSYKAFFKRAMSGEAEVSMSDFELGQVTAEAGFCPAMVRYSVQVRDEVDNLEGILVVNMWGKRLDDAVQTALGGYPGTVYVAELNPEEPARDGIYLYHPETSRRFANQVGTDYRLSNELSQTEWQAVETTELYGSLFRDDGRMLFYRKFFPDPARSVGWLLVIEASSNAVLGPIRNMRNSIWLLVGVVLVVSLLVAVWVTFLMTRPMQHLASIITQYADGDRSARYREPRHDEIGAAGHAFNYLAESLERANRERDRAQRAVQQSERLAAVGQLAAGIGHEINNPLMNIMSLASLIEQSVDSCDAEQIRSDVELLQKEGERCARVVQGILNFARENKPSYRKFDMGELVEESLALMDHRIRAADISVELEIAQPLSMEGDPNQLQQVLVNVLLNALQAAPQGSVIKVVGRHSDDAQHVQLEVIDEGSGVNEEDMERVFNPFFTTKPEGHGTGLGLSVSYGIVRRHNGTLILENEADRGAKVVIRLPLQCAEQVELPEEMMEARNVG